MATTPHPHPRRLLALFLSAPAFVAALLAAGSGPASADDASVQSLDVERLLPALSAAQSSKDRLSPGARELVASSSTLGLEPASTRRLATVEGAAFWSAVTQRDDVCIVAEYVATYDDHGSPISGVATACDTRVEFARDGVALEMTVGDANGRQVDESFAVLTPPGLDTEALTSELDHVADTLLVGDARVNIQRVGDSLTATLG